MIENWMELSFHPVFNLDIWHVVEVLNVSVTTVNPSLTA